MAFSFYLAHPEYHQNLLDFSPSELFLVYLNYRNSQLIPVSSYIPKDFHKISLDHLEPRHSHIDTIIPMIRGGGDGGHGAHNSTFTYACSNFK